jgi:6-phosphogluconolactonase
MGYYDAGICSRVISYMHVKQAVFVLCLWLISIMVWGVDIKAAGKGRVVMKEHEPIKVYIGTYTSAGSRGIYLSELDPESGRLSEPVLAAELDSPGFLKFDSDRKVLYSTGNPDGPGEQSCSVAGFKVLENGGLDLINTVTVAELKLCHITCMTGGNILMGADYGHAKAAVFPIDSNGMIAPPDAIITYDTACGVNAGRQSSPHVHSINPDISGKYIFVCDFSSDAVRVYKVLSEPPVLEVVGSAAVAPGAGPRHLVCHPNGRYVYVINELNGTIACFDFNNGKLKQRQVVETLPDDYKQDNTTAEIAISPDMRFLYASNRGHDSIAYYRINRDSGELSRQGIISTEGEHPRNFAIEPSGRFMLVSNRDSGNVVVFRIDQNSGCPVYGGGQIKLSLPMCVAFAEE